MISSTNPVTVRTLEVVFEGVQLDKYQNTNWLAKTLDEALPHDLIHNHTPNGGVFYRYPKMQFRKQQSKAVVWAMDEAVEILESILDEDRLPVNFLLSQECKRQETVVAIIEEFHTYHLKNWVALNGDNLQKWKKARSLSQKASLLEGILTANLLEFCKAIGYIIPNGSLVVNMLDYRADGLRFYPSENQQVSLETFSVLYECNLVLPEGVGLGKAKRKGFGYQHAASNQQQLRPKRTRILFQSHN